MITLILYYLLGFVIIIVLGQTLSIILHELGHLFFAVLFTKDPVILVLGYGIGEFVSVKPIHIGRVAIYIKFNLLLWRGGAVHMGKTESRSKRVLIYLAGPAMNIMIILVIVTFWKYLDYKIAYLFLATQNALLVTINLIPFQHPIGFNSSAIYYNDGRSVLNLFVKKKAVVSAYHQIMESYNVGDLDRCSSLIKKHKKSVGRHPEIERIETLIRSSNNRRDSNSI